MDNYHENNGLDSAPIGHDQIVRGGSCKWLYLLNFIFRGYLDIRAKQQYVMINRGYDNSRGQITAIMLTRKGVFKIEFSESIKREAYKWK